MLPLAVHGAVFDVNGVLMRGNLAVSGAPEGLAALARLGVRTMIFSNDSEWTAAEWVQFLGAAGFDLRTDQVMTAGLAAVDWLARRQAGARVLVLGSDSMRGMLRAQGLQPVGFDTPADVVLIGEGQSFDDELIVRAARRVMAGARLVVACLDTQAPGEAGMRIWRGSVLAHAVSAAAMRRPVVVGKPSAWAARRVLARLQTVPAHTVMVGDQSEDMRLARAGGMGAVLVLSGFTRPGAWSRWRRPWQPDMVLPDVGGLPDLVSGGWGWGGEQAAPGG